MEFQTLFALFLMTLFVAVAVPILKRRPIDVPPARSSQKPERGAALSEVDAARTLHTSVFQGCQQVWPETYAFLRGSDDRFGVEDPVRACVELAFALLTLELYAIGNVTATAARADQIRELVYMELNMGKETWANEAIKAYALAYERGAKESRNPVESVADELLGRWLGPRITEIRSQITGRPDALLNMKVVQVLVQLAGSWRSIADRHRIVPA